MTRNIMRPSAILLFSVSVSAVLIPPIPPTEVIQELAAIAKLFDSVEAGWKEANGALKAAWERIEHQFLKGLPFPNSL